MKYAKIQFMKMQLLTNLRNTIGQVRFFLYSGVNCKNTFFLMSKTPCEFRYWQWLKCREFVTYVVQHWLGLNQMIVLRMSYDPFINIWFVIFPFTYLLGSYSWIIFCIFFKLKNCLSQMKIATQSMEEEFKATRYNRRYGGLLREQREKQFTMG